MKQISYTKIAATAKGKRLWLEGKRLADCGFIRGARYTATVFSSGKDFTLSLVVDTSGNRKVSGRKRGEKEIPIIDLCDSSLLPEVGSKVRATFAEGKIVITIHHEEQAKVERENSIREALSGRKYMTEGSACTGIGVSTLAIHDELKASGIASTLEWVVDCEGKYLQVAMDNNVAVTKDTTIFEATLEEVEPSLLSPVDLMSVSLPCTGHSIAGKSKNKISNAEEHITAATSVFGCVNILKAANPALFISENVVEAQNSTTYTLLKAEIRRLGYKVYEVVLDGDDAGTLENRRRYYLVAITEGIAPEQLAFSAVPFIHEKLGDILENVSSDDASWSDNQYLKDKQVRDSEAGKGFANRQLVTAETKRVGTIGRHYNKRRSTEPFVVRSDGKERLLTVKEHAAVKRISADLVKGVATTTAHEGLGQSVLPGHLTVIVKAIIEAIRPTLQIAV